MIGLTIAFGLGYLVRSYKDEIVKFVKETLSGDGGDPPSAA